MPAIITQKEQKTQKWKKIKNAKTQKEQNMQKKQQTKKLHFRARYYYSVLVMERSIYDQSLLE